MDVRRENRDGFPWMEPRPCYKPLEWPWNHHLGVQGVPHPRNPGISRILRDANPWWIQGPHPAHPKSQIQWIQNQGCWKSDGLRMKAGKTGLEGSNSHRKTGISWIWEVFSWDGWELSSIWDKIPSPPKAEPPRKRIPLHENSKRRIQDPSKGNPSQSQNSLNQLHRGAAGAEKDGFSHPAPLISRNVVAALIFPVIYWILSAATNPPPAQPGNAGP